MSFFATISVLQNTLGQVEISDRSDYSIEHKSAFVNRQLFLYKKDGSMLEIFPQFTFADYPDDKIVVSLSQDYCLRIVMVLTPIVALAGGRYFTNEIRCFPYYAEQYRVQLGLSLSRNPLLRSDANFYSVMQQYYVNMKLAKLAADNLQQAASQFWLDRMATTMTQVSVAQDQSVAVSHTTDAVVLKYTFKAVGNEGDTFIIPALRGKKIVWFFRDDPRPLWEVLSNPQPGEYTFASSTGQIKTGVELQPLETIQIQYTNQ